MGWIWRVPAKPPRTTHAADAVHVLHKAGILGIMPRILDSLAGD
jgi:hypothetical protein